MSVITASRNQAIIRERLSGWPLRKIGHKYDLSRQRIDQIVRRAGFGFYNRQLEVKLAEKYCVLANPQMTNKEIVNKYSIRLQRVRNIRNINKIIPPERTLKYRFTKKVKKSKHGCWVWQGRRTITGYGRIHIREEVFYAHRVAWEITNGNISDNAWVLHRCNNFSCVNPKHLYLGTSQDSVRDRDKNGHHGTSKLKPHQVRAIKYMLKKGVQDKIIARYFSVSEPTIYFIKMNRTHKVEEKSFRR